MKFFSIINYLLLACVCSFSITKPHDYKILVLPSGAATAVISATLLQHLEEKTGQSVNKMFDEIWCSSAGSIIAALVTKKSQPIKAQAVVEFFNNNFANYCKAYRIFDALKKIVGAHTPLSNTAIPLRILTSIVDPSFTQGILAPKKWKLYDFSSDGAGGCDNSQIPLCSAVKGSCTVYPYLFLQPEKIKIHKKEYVYCIDSGSLICNPPVTDPTAYFLEQALQRLKPEDTLTVYFLCTVFTPTLDLQEIEHVLQKYPQFSSKVNYYEDSVDQKERKQIEIINIPLQSNCDQIIKKYINKSSTPIQLKIKFLTAFLAKIVGEENAAANLLATGTIPLSELIKEAETIIKKSKNFKTVVGMLQKNN